MFTLLSVFEDIFALKYFLCVITNLLLTFTAHSLQSTYQTVIIVSLVNVVIIKNIFLKKKCKIYQFCTGIE